MAIPIARQRRRLAAIVPVLVLVALLAPMVAGAVLPDQTWIAGLYDGADDDEILLLVSSAAAPTVDITSVWIDTSSQVFTFDASPLSPSDRHLRRESRAPPVLRFPA